MILYSGLITLDYNPATDILETSMPDVRQFASSEVMACVDIIVSHIHNYDIKKLLLDSSKSVVDVEMDEYKAVSEKFARSLLATRLRKLARIATADAVREAKSTRVSTDLLQELNFPITFGNFTNRKEAMRWLLQD